MAERTSLDFTLDKHVSKRISDWFQKLLQAFFEVFYKQYKNANLQFRPFSKNRQKIFHAIAMAMYSIQLLSLIFPPSTPNWDTFSWFSHSIGIVRGDYLLIMLGLGVPCYFVALVITILIFFSLLLVLVKSLQLKKFNIQNYKFTLTTGLIFIKNNGFIPFLCIFTAVQKSSSLGLANYADVSKIALPVPYLAEISPCFAVILVFLALVENSFQYEQFLADKKKSIFSRAHGKIETLRIILSTSLVYSYFFLKSSQEYFHYLVSLCIGGVLWMSYTLYLPFYHDFANFTHSAAFLLLTWGSLVQLLAGLMGNSTVIFTLLIFVSPCLAVIQWNLLILRKFFIQNHFKDSILSNIYQYELLIRESTEKLLSFLKQNPNGEEVKRLKHEIFLIFRHMKRNFKPNNMQSAWEFIFAFSLLKDEGLARIKLIETQSIFDIEGSYLHYKYSKMIDDFSQTYLEEVDFIKFRTIYEEALKQDKKTHYLQFDFWKELSLEQPNVKNLEKIAYKLQDYVKKCKKTLQALTVEYPKNQLALRLFGSFLLDVYNDNIKGNDLISRAEAEKIDQRMRNSGSYERFNYFDDTNGIIIVSAEADNLGNITSINQQASELLSTQINFAVSMNISNFLPPPVNIPRLHNTFISKFVENSESTSVNVPFLNYFVDAKGFLVEVFMQIKCVSLDSVPFLLCGLKRTNLLRETILYEGDLILASTRGFAEMVGHSFTETSLKGYLADLVIKGFSQMAKEKNHIFQYMIPQTVNFLSMKFMEIQIKSYTFKFLVCTSDVDEVEKWRNSEELNNFEEFSAVKKISVVCKEGQGDFEHKGILKIRTQSVKKNLNVSFNITPTFFYLDETDFRGGKSVSGRVKDASAIKVQGKEKVKRNSETPLANEIFDLKDLESDVLKRNNENEEGSVVKKSAASVASSSQSSNASFTASPEAKKLLSGVTKSMTCFKVSFFLTILIVNIAVIAIVVYLNTVSNNYIDTLIIKDLSERRNLMSNLTSFARDLELINYGQEAFSEPTIRDLLYNDILEYQKIVSVVEAKINDWDGVTQNYYSEEFFFTWGLVNKVPTLKKMNLLNIMKEFINSALAIHNTPISEITLKNPDLYYLYRNGFGESLQAVNNSNGIFIAQQEKNTDEILLIMMLLASGAICLMILCFFAVIIPTLFSVEKSNRTVWKIFYLLPLDLVQEMQGKSQEKLEMTYGVELEIDPERKFKNLTGRKDIKMLKKWPHILLWISVYYAISTAIFVFFYYYAYSELGNILRTKPKLVNTSGLRTFSINSAAFWLQELKYSSSPLSYLNETSDFRIIISPEKEIEKVLDLLKYTENSLIFGKFSGIGKSSMHEDYLWNQACFSSGCLALAKGAHAGVLNFIAEVSDLQARIGNGENLDLTDFFKKKNELAYGEGLLCQMYEDFMTENINTHVTTVIWVTSMYCIAVTLLYFIIFIPIINSAKAEITKVWKLGRLIPIDQRNKIMQAFKQASNNQTI